MKYLNKTLFLILLFGFLDSCNQKPKEFKPATFLTYSLDVPNHLTLIKEGKWKYNQDNKIEYFELIESDTENKSLEEHLNLWINFNKEKNPKLLNSQLQDRKTSNSNNTLVRFYQLNNNPNPDGYKVMTYYVYAVKKINDKIIFFQSTSLGSNNQDDMEKTILSLK